ncbi:UNVERIFIED_CONTAM: tyrosine-type recombinase/integrase [Spiribacter pallidus]
MPKVKLTEKLLEQTNCAAGKRTTNLIDTEVHGLVAEIRSNGTGTFYLRYTDSRGKRRHYRLGRVGGLTLADARKAAQRVSGQIANGIDPREKKAEHRATPTVSQFVSGSFLPYLLSYKRDRVSDESLLRNHILPAIGNLYMDEVRRQHLVDLFTQHQIDHKPGSTNRVIVLVRHMFNCAISWEVPGVTKNPSKDIPKIADEGQRQRFLSVEEAQRLMRAVEESDSKMLKYIVAMLLLTGARRNEVLHAKWEDFDFSARQWLLPKNKSARTRYIPLSDAAIRLLETVPRVDGCPYAFPNPDTGKPYMQIFNSWDTARKRAGLEDLRIHDLRHSFASFLVNSGRSLYEVQNLLGHARPVTTQRYAHLSQETLHEATGSVGASLEKAFTQPVIEAA